MPASKTTSNNLELLEKMIILNLAESKPQTKRETAKAISKQYKSTWNAFKRLEKKKLIKQATTITYNNTEYPRYWLTDEGILIALMENANPKNLLKQAEALYPENKNTHCFLEIAPLFDPQVMRMAHSSLKGKDKLGPREIIILFLSQPSIAMDGETAKKIIISLKKYPDLYNKLKTAILEIKNQLNQLPF